MYWMMVLKLREERGGTQRSAEDDTKDGGWEGCMNANTPVLAVDGVAVSRGVDDGEAKLHSPLLDLHRRRLDLHRPLDFL